MDPITLEKLLPIADAIEERRENNRIPVLGFEQIIVEQTRAKNLERRSRDILRVVTTMGWITNEHTDMLYLTQQYVNFIEAWNKGDLQSINEALAQYPPYERFLHCLRSEKIISVPKRGDKEARERLKNLLEDYDLTFPAFNTFQYWVVSVGQGYLSPFNESLYWGGDWNDSVPSTGIIKLECRKSYEEIEKTSGYSNIGRVADIVCRELQISFQAFEAKLNNLIIEEPTLVTLAPSTIREPSRRFQITTVRPRSKILKEKMAAKLGGNKQPEIQWLERRYVEDGIYVGGKLVKLIRWGVSL
ncbi:MAG: hypothetical protein KDJ65_02825 [Anaerolineae bacterium]|nr:hypothetical protein [Anaerolineae bacterium]